MSAIKRYLLPALLLASAAAACDDNGPAGPATPNTDARVAVIELPGGRPELYVQNLDGSGRKRIHFTGAEDPIAGNFPHMPDVTDENIVMLGPLRWSPDGTRIAIVVTMAADQSMIVVMDADGGNARVASVNTQIILSDIEWSPDGKRIAYTMSTLPHAHGIDVFLTDLQGNRVERLTTASGLGIAGVELRFDATGSALYYSRIVDEEGPPYFNSSSRITRLDLASGQPQIVADRIVGQVNGIARSGDWVLVVRNTGELQVGDYDRELLRRNIASGAETVLAPSADLQYAKLDARDAEVLLLTDQATDPAEDLFVFTVFPANGGPAIPVRGTGDAVKALAVHFP